MFLYKILFFVDFFFSFNPNRVMGINGGYFSAIDVDRSFVTLTLSRINESWYQLLNDIYFNIFKDFNMQRMIFFVWQRLG